MARRKLKTSTDQRRFTMVYNDFLESDVLDHREKLLFIVLKKFGEQSFPSLQTLARITGMSKTTVQRVIKSLEDKGVLQVQHRKSEERGYQSNLYTLYDYAEMWNSKNEEELKIAISLAEEQLMIKALQQKGYIVSKEKEPVSETDQSPDTDTMDNHKDFINYNNTDKVDESQPERYTLQQVKDLFDYDILKNDYPGDLQLIDAMMEVLHSAMCETRATIRVAGQNKPVMVVIGKLMRLTYQDIIYAINKFKGATDRIKNTEAYTLTLLYKAKEQGALDLTNQVAHDMAHWNEGEA